MSRLKSKLGRKLGQRQATDLVERLQKRIDRIEGHSAVTRDHGRGDLGKSFMKRGHVAGEVVETSEGPLLVRQKVYPASYRHGRFGSSDFLGVGPGLAALAGRDDLVGFAPRGALFLDTETTGLAGGTGTLPFLVGLGWLEKDGRFSVEQLFCREPGEERAQLTLLARRLAGAALLVTFNGRGFDMPLLNTRFVLQRMKNPGYALPHLDLLIVARRVFKRRLESCSLGSLESAVLGFERVGDIPGHAIPAAYSAYLRGGPVEPIEAVLEHNALDLVGLAALGAVLEEMYADPEKVEHAADHVGLALAAIAAGEQEAADSHLDRAGETGSAYQSAQALSIAARVAVRRGEIHRARMLLEKALMRDRGDAGINLAMAKLLEHKTGDLEQALLHARLTKGAEGQAASDHRVARLERRLAGRKK